MDIQDTREQRQAFEAIPGNARLLRGAIFKDGEYVALSLFDESSKELAAQLNYGWSIWQAAKAQAVPDGFVLMPKKSIEHWYLDEGECLWMGEPDNWLCDMDVGDVQEVEHKEYIVTESNTLYATKVWDAENQAVSSWEFFSSKDDAEKAAEYCKAMVEASQEQAND